LMREGEAHTAKQIAQKEIEPDRGGASQRAVQHRLGAELGLYTHNLCEICLVDDEDVRLGHTGPTFAWHLVAPSNVDHIDGQICQLAGEVSR
jgi:hypothetical protein